MIPPGSILKNTYRILGVLGKGGLGTVYLGIDRNTGIRIAIKETEPDETGRKLWDEIPDLSFTREIEGIVSVKECFQTDSSCFLVMEYAEGTLLQDLWRSRSAKISEILTIALRVGKILQKLHEVRPKLIYGDLKPSNIILQKGLNPVLIDPDSIRCIGSSKNKERSGRQGTPGFAAPEIYDPKGSFDHRADIYSFGAFIFWMLTGAEPPIAGVKLESLLKNPDLFLLQTSFLERSARVRKETVRIFLPILKKSMRFSKEDRYQTTAELCRELSLSNKKIIFHKLRCKRNLVSLAGAFLLLALISCTNIENKNEILYRNRLSQAEISTDGISLFEGAIDLYPDRPEGYRRLLRYLIKDGRFDNADAAVLERLVSRLGKEEAMRAGKREEYLALCREVAEAYLLAEDMENAKERAEQWQEKAER